MLTLRTMPEPVVRKWLDRYIAGGQEPVEAVHRIRLVASQRFIFEPRVEFYRECIRTGLFPPACEGVLMDTNDIVLAEGHHRAEAWFGEGFFYIPVRVQRP